jgi:hypothetical protein
MLELQFGSLTIQAFPSPGAKSFVRKILRTLKRFRGDFGPKSHEIAKSKSFKLKDFGTVARQTFENERSSPGGRG